MCSTFHLVRTSLNSRPRRFNILRGLSAIEFRGQNEANASSNTLRINYGYVMFQVSLVFIDRSTLWMFMEYLRIFMEYFLFCVYLWNIFYGKYSGQDFFIFSATI